MIKMDEFANLENTELQRRVLKRFIGGLIKRGNRQEAERMFREISDHLFSLGEHPFITIFTALHNIKPSFSLFSKRVGGTIYKLPVFFNRRAELYCCGSLVN